MIPASAAAIQLGLAAWLPASMLDWPGRIATTAFVRGCPFRCAYCHNPDLLFPGPSEDVDALMHHLESRRGWLDGLVITGGEPTADPSLLPFLAAVKEARIPVKLDTNGSQPDILGRILEERLVDMVAMDVKTLPERYDALTGVAGSHDAVERSIRLVIGSGIEHEFRTTAWPGALTIEDFPRIAASLVGADRYVIQQFRAAQTLDPSAGSVLPFHTDALRDAARQCNRFVPTILRGAV
ncbi:MAG: anaerobic ribonucleoside-triphosphate reductase activating protein [Coriobacteriia bacterium]|nr:anaerobic ribonucleoside-triphosphate reductase activating protein [Coriobacteriia bacterium]